MNCTSPVSKATPHVVIVSFPMASHPSTLFTVAKILANSAPSATFSFICSPKSFPSLSEQSSQTRNLKLSNGLKVQDENYDDFFKNMPQNIKDGIDIAVENEGGLSVTCIVSDGLMPIVGEIARELNVTWIPVRFCGPAMVLSHFYYNELKQAYVKEDSENSVSFSPSLSVLRFKDVPDFILTGNLVPLNAGSSEEYPKADAVILNTFEGLDPLIDLEFKSRFKKYLPIGPTVLLAPPPPLAKGDKCMAWLDRQAASSVIYICFGTFNSPSKQELAELADALSEIKEISFLWSLKEGEKELPCGFVEEEERGMVVEWAPQAQVLMHRAVGGFLTHGGWNSVMESIAGGVPMICRPFRWDQLCNARMVSHVYRVGVRLDEEVFRKEEVVRTLRMVMLEEAGEKLRARARVVKEMAENAVSPDGISSRNLKSVVDIMHATN